MAHDASKVLLGTNRSSFKVVTNRLGTIAAGLAVRLKADNTISVAAADGSLLGISFGKDLSDIGRTNICHSGLDVPIQLTASFTPVVGEQVFISDTTGKAGATGAGFTGVNAVWKTAVLSGIAEDGTSVDVALADFVGGL